MRVCGVSIEISLRGRCDLPAPVVLHVSSACCSTAAADMNRDVARSEESRKKALVFAYPDHKDDCRTGEEDERFPDVDRSKTKTHG
jgi:hypothetical protein